MGTQTPTWLFPPPQLVRRLRSLESHETGLVKVASHPDNSFQVIKCFPRCPCHKGRGACLLPK